MGRLTERDEFGNANILGVDSMDLQCNLGFEEFNRVTKALNKLADYEDLEEQNKLLRPPCAVGETVYEVQDLRKRIQPYTIIAVHVSNRGNFYRWELKDGKGIYGNVNGFSEYALGKSVFLTYEGAEAALKEIGERMG